jgi:hypothetical protein
MRGQTSGSEHGVIEESDKDDTADGAKGVNADA